MKTQTKKTKVAADPGEEVLSFDAHGGVRRNKSKKYCAFNAHFAKHPDTLFINREGELFLRSTDLKWFKEASVVEVMDWCVTSEDIAPYGFSGSMIPIIKAARAEIKRLRALCGERKSS